MARARNIKPAFFTNEDLAECSPLARLLFVGLWTLADRAGRLEDRPKRIKSELFPYDDCDVGGLLDELAARCLIVRYESHGTKCVWIPKFARHQRPHKNEAPSALPEFSGNVPIDSDQGAHGFGLNEECGMRNDERGMMNPDLSSEVASDSEPNLVVFPTVGNGSTEWGLTQSAADELSTAFPDLDILAESRKALAWIKANPRNRKTPTGMPRFLTNWLSRANDRGTGKVRRRGGHKLE